MLFKNFIATAFLFLTVPSVSFAQQWVREPDESVMVPSVITFVYLACAVGIYFRLKKCSSAQRMFGVIGAVVGGLVGSGFGVAAGGGAVSGMVLLAMVGFFVGSSVGA